MELVIDNSARNLYSNCKKKYFFKNIHGLQSNYGSTALRYGSCWHKIMEGYYSSIKELGWSKTEEEKMLIIMKSLEMGKKCYDEDTEKQSFYDDYKNFNTAVEAFTAYLEHYSEDPNFIEILSTERSFECPIEPENSVEEKILSKLPPITFTGRLDLGLRMDNVNWINDFKTTGWYLDKVIQQANRSAQFIGYAYAGKKVLDFEVQGCIGNFAYIGATKSRKTGLYGKKRFDFRRIPQVYSKNDLKAWKLNFIDTVKEIYFSTKENIFPESFDNCYQYGACEYLKLCQQQKEFEDLNLSEFHVDFWNVLDEH